MLAAAIFNVWLAADGSETLSRVLAPAIAYIFGLAYMIPSITVLILDQLPNNRGSASAMQSFAQTGGNALVAGIVVPLVHASHLQITMAMLALNVSGLLLGVIWWLCYRQELATAATEPVGTTT